MAYILVTTVRKSGIEYERGLHSTDIVLNTITTSGKSLAHRFETKEEAKALKKEHSCLRKFRIEKF